MYHFSYCFYKIQCPCAISFHKSHGVYMTELIIEDFFVSESFASHKIHLLMRENKTVHCSLRRIKYLLNLTALSLQPKAPAFPESSINLSGV